MLKRDRGMRFEQECEQVPGQVLRTLLSCVDRAGYDALAYLKHLPLEPRHLLSLRAHLSWDELATLVDRFVLDRGQPALNRVARDVVTQLPGLRLLGGLMLPPRVFFRVLFELANRGCFWSVTWDEATGAATFELKKTMRGCAAVFEALSEMLASAPRLLNLPDLRVESRVHSHGGHYVLEVPRGRGFHARVSEHQVAAIIEDFTALTAWGAASSDGGLPTIAQLEQRFGMTRAEGRVVRRLTAGRSLGDIARELNIGAETVRTHAKRAMQKTDTHRQAELVALVLRMSGATRDE